MTEDIASILKEWDAEPNPKRIRKIIGNNGTEKLQIRVPFGLLQLEADGRPDGKRPYGKESLLEHFASLIDTYKKEYGTDEGFKLDRYDCERMQEESLQYYHRYVSLFEIEDYVRAERDTTRNLLALDMIKKYAERPEDSLDLEKFRPYITMMNARAKANIYLIDDNYSEAIRCINDAIDSITDFYKEIGISDEQMEESQELAVLKKTANEIHDEWENAE